MHQHATDQKDLDLTIMLASRSQRSHLQHGEHQHPSKQLVGLVSILSFSKPTQLRKHEGPPKTPVGPQVEEEVCQRAWCFDAKLQPNSPESQEEALSLLPHSLDPRPCSQ